MTDEASIVNHDNRPKTNKIARAMYMRRVLAAGLSDRPSSPIVIHHETTHYKNGAQGRIRTFVAHNAADLQSAAINHSATCAFPLRWLQPCPCTMRKPLAKHLRADISNWLVDTARRERRAVTTKLQNPSRCGVKTGAGEG